MYEQKESLIRETIIHEVATAIRVFAIVMLLLGIAYPLGITVIARFTMPHQANGSFIVHNRTVVGSLLIGQRFEQPQYFQSRPSSIAYNAMISGASNLGPTNAEFINQTVAHLTTAQQINLLSPQTVLPADMVLASGSGLDPHISPENAKLQAYRIALQRSMSTAEILLLIDRCTEYKYLSYFWGEPAVNVLAVNIALDTLQGTMPN